MSFKRKNAMWPPSISIFSFTISGPSYFLIQSVSSGNAKVSVLATTNTIGISVFLICLKYI
jgi:hypothetical protein